MEQLTIITGASSGIGAELASLAEHAGHTVATVSRRPGPGEHLAADLSDPTSWTVVGDWTAKLVESQPWDRIVFIHNAGSVHPGGFAGEVDSEAYIQNILLNSASPQALGDRFIAIAEDAGVPAQFQVISSGAGKRPFLGWSSYCAGKAAGDMWVQAAGLERGARGSAVTVVSVGPGVVDTDMQKHIRSQPEEAFPLVAQFQAMKDQLAAPRDVAAKLLHLASLNAGDSLGSLVLENGAVIDVRDF